MRPQVLTLLATQLLAQHVQAWQVNMYTGSCEEADTAGGSAGSADDELWCLGTTNAKSMRLTGIEEDNMVVFVFSFENSVLRCEAEDRLAEVWTDGCFAIPSQPESFGYHVLPCAGHSSRC